MNIIPEPKKHISGRIIFKDKVQKLQITTNAREILMLYPQLFGPDIVADDAQCDTYYITSRPGERLSVNEVSEKTNGNDQGYILKMDEDELYIFSLSKRGLFYGIQTYIQLLEDDEPRQTRISDWPDVTTRGFHFEVRFGMPKFQRVLEIIDEAAKHKFNTILFEYEDKLPYQKHPDIKSKYALTTKQHKQLLCYAKERFIDVIPLVQTLGHLEFVLKHEKYYPLREMRLESRRDHSVFSPSPAGFRHHNVIDEICASNEKAVELAEDILRENISMHPESRYIHIGCDEAWNLMTCPECVKKYKEYGANRLFLEHINRMAKIVTHAGKIPIIWDDMLRKFDDKDFSFLTKDIVIMCWVYFKGQFEEALPLVKKYIDKGFTVFGAPAAKCNERGGAQFQDLPNYDQRIENIDLWGDIIKKTGISGIFTTVWSGATGTIAPPHPFFDTVWFSVLFSAQKYWNLDKSPDGFDGLYIRSCFGMDDPGSCFSNDNSKSIPAFEYIEKNCTKNEYLARVYKTMSMLSAYRLKSISLQRELYKLNSDVTDIEKKIVKDRVDELLRMKEYLYKEVKEIISQNYNTDDTNEFLQSRFYADEKIFRGCL